MAELCHRHGMSDSSFYKWRAKYGGMDAEPAVRHWFKPNGEAV
jgi:putative transposase